MLGVPGFQWGDLFDPLRLRELHDVFDRWFQERAPAAWSQFDAYRACQGEGMTAEAASEALLAAAPHVSAFLANLFVIEKDVDAVRAQVSDREPLWRFKRDFAKKRVLRDGAGKGFLASKAARDLPEAEALTLARRVSQLALALTGSGDEELTVAKATNALFEVDDIARKAAKAGGAAWTDELRARASSLRERLSADARAKTLLETDRDPTDAEHAALVALVLDAIELTLARRHADHADPASRWATLKSPHTLDYANLVHIRRPDAALPELFVGPPEERRQRADFKLTDKRGSAREVESEVDYCLYCHNRDKDSCSKGFREKTGGYKKNPLGVELRGCPLEEKISEMHTMRRDGDVVAALALVALDNPMCAGTGHRICNDCMKACIFQKQEPVNIPQIETRVLTETLSLPWGMEIYGLLTRWNPLNVRRPYSRTSAASCSNWG